MRIGELDEQITIQSDTPTRGNSGSSKPGWGGDFTTWAKVEVVGGAERPEAGRVTEKLTAKFTIRYRTGMTAQHRIQWDSKNWDVNSAPIPVDRKRFLVLVATETNQ